MAEFLTPDICIIGGGAAGLAAATLARRYGASVVLIEKGRLGGDTLNSGSIPSKAVVAAGRRAEALRTAGPFGIANAEPKINARGVFDHVHRVIDAAAVSVTPDYLEALGIRLLAGEGRFLDRRTVAAGDARIRARRFVIATGARPLVPNIPGLGEIPYFTSTSIFDNPRKLTHLVIIGGDAVAIELAQAFRRLGAAVTVVDTAPMLLAGDDPELAEIALRRLAEEGVVLRPATEVTALQQRSLGIGVAVRSDAGGEAVLDASHVLVAAGRAPYLEGLGLDEAGIRRRSEGGGPPRLLLRGLRTTNRRVYAVGDGAGGVQQTHAAAHQARIVVRSALFGLPAWYDPAAVPSAVFTDPELATVGLSEPMARTRGRSYKILRLSLAENDRARIERQSYGLAKLVVGRGGRLLGAGIVGTGAAEMISLFAFAIARRLPIAAFGGFVAPYPTLTEIARGLADEAARTEFESPRLARLLALRRMLP